MLESPPVRAPIAALRPSSFRGRAIGAGGSRMARMVPGLSAWLLLAALVAQGPAAPAAAPGVDVAVTATAPIDAQHLADVLRAYLDEYGVRVESAAATAPGDLRRQLSDARQLGERVRAMAVVRVQGGEGAGGRGTVEIDIVDLATEKVLIAEVPRPQRDEDLYRALALKIQASLRATLSEAPERLGPGSGLARLVSSGSAAAAPAPEQPRGGWRWRPAISCSSFRCRAWGCRGCRSRGRLPSRAGST